MLLGKGQGDQETSDQRYSPEFAVLMFQVRIWVEGFRKSDLGTLTFLGDEEHTCCLLPWGEARGGEKPDFERMEGLFNC